MFSTRFFGALVAVILSVSSMYAQKYGHLNLGNAVALMPETKAADAELEAFQKQMVAKGEEMAKKFQEKYSKLVQDAQTGTFPPAALKTREEELVKERDAILKYEQEIETGVQNKRGELLKPIFDKVEKAIAEVAKENGYQLVFDSSIFNTLLFAQDQDDLMPLVKAKLGLQ